MSSFIDPSRRDSFKVGSQPDISNYNVESVSRNNNDEILTSGRGIDLDMVNKSLARVNPFGALNRRKTTFFDKHHNANQTLLALQVLALATSEDDSVYINITLRDLLNLVLTNSMKYDQVLQPDNKAKEALSTVNTDQQEAQDRHQSALHTTNNHRASTLTRVPSQGGIVRVPSLIDSKLANERNQADKSPTFFLSGHLHNYNPSEGLEIGFNAVNVLRLRDLRRLDFQFNPVDEPNVLVRRHVVLFSFDPIRAVIMADRLILIVPDGADSLLQILRQYMSEWNGAANINIPFEAHAYEALLTTVGSIISQEFDLLRKEVEENLSFFKTGAILPVDKQEKMRYLKNSVNSIKSRISGHKRVISELMEDDEIMALMNLTRLRDKPQLYKAPLVPEILSTHEETEDLLETFLMDYNSLESKIEHLRVQIQSAEELVSLRLDTSRNELLVANTAMSILACCIGFNSYITGIFGMNLDNTASIQPVPGIFFTVFCVTFALIFTSFYLIVLYYTETGVLPKRVPKRIQKVIKR